eukprot:gnl/TRDRNA2_/TRDRNA2_169212_c0_seq1.p2 gnl/TRDRNA2_/TRDRNA2_169212_c0~~gnl/TRDRNA2_/TRDRNA2_169212_c0_seq1.p2  ORF type:complete len:328 (+),score=95.44 gnl/TRDRNA2_/TRDRNA2_169212_c0_seq1:115-1098(+)
MQDVHPQLILLNITAFVVPFLVISEAEGLESEEQSTPRDDSEEEEEEEDDEDEHEEEEALMRKSRELEAIIVERKRRELNAVIQAESRRRWSEDVSQLSEEKAAPSSARTTVQSGQRKDLGGLPAGYGVAEGEARTRSLDMLKLEVRKKLAAERMAVEEELIERERKKLLIERRAAEEEANETERRRKLAAQRVSAAVEERRRAAAAEALAGIFGGDDSEASASALPSSSRVSRLRTSFQEDSPRQLPSQENRRDRDEEAADEGFDGLEPVVGMTVEYWSKKKGEWMEAVVEDRRESMGFIVYDLKCRGLLVAGATLKLLRPLRAET